MNKPLVPVNSNHAPLSDAELDAVAGGGNDAYFVKCDSETTTQSDSAVAGISSTYKVPDVTLKRG